MACRFHGRCAEAKTHAATALPYREIAREAFQAGRSGLYGLSAGFVLSLRVRFYRSACLNPASSRINLSRSRKHREDGMSLARRRSYVRLNASITFSREGATDAGGAGIFTCVFLRMRISAFL
jgi:hypothetical protein